MSANKYGAELKEGLMVEVQESPRDAKTRKAYAKLMATWEAHPSVARFMRKLDKPSTRLEYLRALSKYLEWLAADYAVEGRLVRPAVPLSPDQLLADNLRCVYGSSPVDTATKRRHTDWLDLYVNEFLPARGVRVLLHLRVIALSRCIAGDA